MSSEICSATIWQNWVPALVLIFSMPTPIIIAVWPSRTAFSLGTNPNTQGKARARGCLYAPWSSHLNEAQWARKTGSLSWLIIFSIPSIRSSQPSDQEPVLLLRQINGSAPESSCFLLLAFPGFPCHLPPSAFNRVSSIQARSVFFSLGLPRVSRCCFQEQQNHKNNAPLLAACPPSVSHFLD